MKKSAILLVAFALLSSCTASPSNTLSNTENIPVDESFELAEGPALMDMSYEDSTPPFFFFLFTHTEDHFNHELSEDRYWRGGEIIEKLAKAYPSIPLTWTIEFQGADANTVNDRNPETGVKDYLLELAEEGLVHFGYHAQHDPTYTDRPQNELSKSPSFDEVYEALNTWISCKKDPIIGGCIADTGGGLTAILENFGEVSIVTGLGVDDGTLIRRSAGSIAVKSFIPDSMLSFAFADHGPITSDPNYPYNVIEFMNIMAPTHDTSSFAFWMDNSIQLNGASLNTADGGPMLAESLEAFERNRPEVMNMGFVSKYMYTKSGTSPTKYGYSNPESPELPEEWLNSSEEIDENYSMTEDAMNVAMEYLSNSEGHFVSAVDIVDLFTSDDYWEVDEDELNQIALWLLNNWEGQTPNWAYDGEDFYSLADSFFLLIHGLRGEHPSSGIVSNYYGPWEQKSTSSSASSMNGEELMNWVADLDLEELTISTEIKIGKKKYAPAQVLYALAYAYALNAEGYSAESIEIPEMTNAPESFEMFEGFGCENCLDTVWTMKPARFQEAFGGTVVPFDGPADLNIKEEVSGRTEGLEFNQDTKENPFEQKGPFGKDPQAEDDFPFKGGPNR